MRTPARKSRFIGGNAALEAALIAPLLTLLAVGIGDYGMAVFRKMQVQHAAQAGTHYAMRFGFDPADIAEAVIAASPGSGISVDPAPVESCGCVAGQAVTPTACSALCPDGSSAGTYVTVSARGTYNTLIPYPGIPTAFEFEASATTRVR